MAENNNILEKLDGLEARYEEVSTLITDPSVIADQQRYVKLTKEYKDLEDIMKLRQKYINCLNGIAEAKDILMNESDPDKFEEYRMSLVQLEEISDKMEYQIADFLNGLTTEPLTDEEADEVKILYRVIGELESLGDSGENISRILERERVHNRKFDEKAVANINLMIDAVTEAYEVMVENLKTAISGNLNDISNAYEAENKINETRNRLRNEGINQIGQQTGNYQSLNYFLDIISELEAMGDFMINVSQAVSKRKAS